MAAVSWKTGTSADWTTASAWSTGTVPDSASDVTIDAPPSVTGGAYTVTIGKGESVAANSISLNGSVNLLGVNQTPYSGAALEIDGTLTFTAAGGGRLGGSLQSFVHVNNGTVINAGTVDGFVQTEGVTLFKGSNPFYITNWLQSLGQTTVDTTSIGEYNAATNTLFDGIFDAKGTGTDIMLGGSLGGLKVDISTMQGPHAGTDPEYWTQLLMYDTGSEIHEWNGTSYVTIESTLKTIGASAILTVEKGRGYTTANTLTVQTDGLLEATSGVLATGGLTIASGGMLTNGRYDHHTATATAHFGNGVASGDTTALTVNGPVANNGTISVFGNGLTLSGALTGNGTLVYSGTTATTVELGSVAAGQTVMMGANDKLILDAPAAFLGSISASGAGDQIVLKGVVADSAAVNGAVLEVKNAGTVVDRIALSGAVAQQPFAVSTVNGSALIQVGVAQPVSPTPPPPVNNPLGVYNTSTAQAVVATGQAYSGPVSGLQNQYINVTSDSLNISVSSDNWFIHSGSGQDAIQVHGGINVIDGGTGSNFLTGGTGTDTFFIDDRGATADIWSTLVNFHAGDACTFWGVDAGFALNWQENQGATGYTGLTLHATESGRPIASMTLAGYTAADLASGKVSVVFGNDPASGSNYLYVHGNS